MWFLQPQLDDYTLSGGGGPVIPADALLNTDGTPLLNTDDVVLENNP